MRYKVGDRVRVKSLNWFKQNCIWDNACKCFIYKLEPVVFTKYMQKFCNQIVTICEIDGISPVYNITEDEHKLLFADWMLEEVGEKMKYKIGDKVKVKPLSWFKENCVREKDSDIMHGGYKNKEVKENFYETDFINDKMLEYCGDELTIKNRYNDAYTVCECDFYWDDWMFEDEEKENKNMYIIIDKEDMGLVTKGPDFKDGFYNTLCEAEVEAQKYAKDMNVSVDKLCVLSMVDNTDVYEFKSALSHVYELRNIKEK